MRGIRGRRACTSIGTWITRSSGGSFLTPSSLLATLVMRNACWILKNAPFASWLESLPFLHHVVSLFFLRKMLSCSGIVAHDIFVCMLV